MALFESPRLGVPEQALVTTGSQKISVSFVERDAGLDNALLAFTVGQDGALGDTQVVFPHTAQVTRDTVVDLGAFESGTKIGFALLQNGGPVLDLLNTDAGRLEFQSPGTDQAFKIAEGVPPELALVGPGGVQIDVPAKLFLTLDSTAATPLENPLNPGGFAQVLSGSPRSSGLVSSYPGDGNADDVADDNPGTLRNGATFAPGKINQAFSLDGVDDFVSGDTTTGLPLGSSPRTITAWVKPDSAGVRGDGIIFHYGIGTGDFPSTNFHLLMNTQGLAQIGNGFGLGLATGTSSLVDGEFHFLAGVYEGPSTNVARIYVDGVEEGSTIITTPGTLDGRFTIGTDLPGPGGQFYDGLIDEVKIYNRALSAAEVQALFETGGDGDQAIRLGFEDAELSQSDADFNDLVIDVQFEALQNTVNVTVPGTSDPLLAGMPNGSTHGTDSAPGQSPTEVVGLNLEGGETLTFAVTGAVAPLSEPDGISTVRVSPGAANGLSAPAAFVEALAGVFLGPDQPDSTPPPEILDFQSPMARDYLTLAPALKQGFFVGDGLTSGGEHQQVIAPDGATRLFLAVMDSNNWSDNLGSFSVQVTKIDEFNEAASFLEEHQSLEPTSSDILLI